MSVLDPRKLQDELSWAQRELTRQQARLQSPRSSSHAEWIREEIHRLNVRIARIRSTLAAIGVRHP